MPCYFYSYGLLHCTEAVGGGRRHDRSLVPNAGIRAACIRQQHLPCTHCGPKSHNRLPSTFLPTRLVRPVLLRTMVHLGAALRPLAVLPAAAAAALAVLPAW